jgi:hypothetical protein
MLDECWDNAMVVRIDEKCNGLREGILRNPDVVACVVEFLFPHIGGSAFFLGKSEVANMEWNCSSSVINSSSCGRNFQMVSIRSERSLFGALGS